MNNFENKYFEYQKLRCPNLKCHNRISLSLILEIDLKQVLSGCPFTLDPSSKK